MTTALERTSGYSLLAPAFFERLARRVAAEEGVGIAHAELMVDQAVAYLATCAQKPMGTPSLAMSRAVDPAWHAFLEYSAEYDAFFEQRGWPKVHHNPCDLPGVTYGSAAELLPLTVDAMRAAGFRVREDMWQAHADCGDTCGDDGVPGNPPDCGHAV